MARRKSAPQNTARLKQERFDWKQIDNYLAPKVKAICQEILDSPKFPVRICITKIIKRVGHKAWIDKRQEKPPITFRVIDERLETFEDFMLRKIKWATERYIEEKKIPSINQFMVRTNLKNKTSAESSNIQQAIKNALSEINNSVGS